ncbi:uncharacterized protein Dip518_000183 [Parelusimicrobium proximum]|uniref:YceD family protein n=1 Tax=Parelusimicrobium proximum TaxID=3228953 RepID=UPI003D17FC9A
MTYNDYDVPESLRFKTIDILRMGKFQATVKIAPEVFADVLDKPNKITSAELKINMSVNKKDIIVFGEVSGGTELVCGRCLDVFKGKFTESFEEIYSTKLEIIDIMSVVVQTLALVENITFVCSDKCKGLCDECGVNKNKTACNCQKEIFSPFAVLKKK